MYVFWKNKIKSIFSKSWVSTHGHEEGMESRIKSPILSLFSLGLLLKFDQTCNLVQPCERNLCDDDEDSLLVGLMQQI